MIENAKLDRLLTKVNCRITNTSSQIPISNRDAEEELKQAVEFRTKLMREVDHQNFTFDA